MIQLIKRLKRKKTSDKELVNLFMTEYQKDYRNALKYGEHIDGNYVRNFLKTN